MSALHLYQPVRIVSLPHDLKTADRIAYGFLVGLEGMVFAINPRHDSGFVSEYGVAVAGLRIGLDRDNVEPIKYLPSPEDFVSLERVPPDGLREAVGA